MPVIETERLTKLYGSHRGIVDVDLTVEPGEVYGFLGPNGAGKTTTIRLLLDLIRPTSGRARVFGIETSADPVAIHRRVGYLPGEFALFDRLTGGQTIEYFANLRGGVDRRYQADLVARLRPRPVTSVQGVLERQQAEGRTGHRAPEPARPPRPRRADVRPGPARPADVLRAPARDRRGRANRVPLVAHPRRGREDVRPGRDHPRRPHRHGRSGRGAPGPRHHQRRAPVRRARPCVGVLGTAGGDATWSRSAAGCRCG